MRRGRREVTLAPSYHQIMMVTRAGSPPAQYPCGGAGARAARRVAERAGDGDGDNEARGAAGGRERAGGRDRGRRRDGRAGGRGSPAPDIRCLMTCSWRDSTRSETRAHSLSPAALPPPSRPLSDARRLQRPGDRARKVCAGGDSVGVPISSSAVENGGGRGGIQRGGRGQRRRRADRGRGRCRVWPKGRKRQGSGRDHALMAGEARSACPGLP